MDYEKKYNETLERAKKLKHDVENIGCSMSPDMLEVIFPELKESEDERIRKALIEVFKEKLERGFEWVEYGIPNRSVLSWLEKQKERGPLTKEEEYNLHRIIEFLEDEACPSEWISLLYDIYCHPHSKQEWSKEETKDLAHILKVLDDCYAYGKHDLSKTDHDNLTSTIKSLRPVSKESLQPHWKPSEEQMEALNALNCHGDLSYVGQQNQLISLYNDLKTLM